MCSFTLGSTLAGEILHNRAPAKEILNRSSPYACRNYRDSAVVRQPYPGTPGIGAIIIRITLHITLQRLRRLCPVREN